MTVRCDISYCQYWDENAGDYIGEGGCTLDEIRINDDYVYDSRPGCNDFEERSDHEPKDT